MKFNTRTKNAFRFMIFVVVIISLISCTNDRGPLGVIEVFELSREQQFIHDTTALSYRDGDADYTITSGYILDIDYNIVYKFSSLIGLEQSIATYSKISSKASSTISKDVISADTISIELISEGIAKIYNNDNLTGSFITATLCQKAEAFLELVKAKSGKISFMDGQTTSFNNSGKLLTIHVMGFVVYYEFAGMALQGSICGDGTTTENAAYYRLIEKGEGPMNLGNYLGIDINSTDYKVYIGNGADGNDVNYTDADDPTQAIKVWDDIDPYRFIVEHK